MTGLVNKNNDSFASDDVSEGCQDKLAFDSKKQADTAKVVAGLQHGAKLKAYLCKKCQLWQLTTNYD